MSAILEFISRHKAAAAAVALAAVLCLAGAAMIANMPQAGDAPAEQEEEVMEEAEEQRGDDFELTEEERKMLASYTDTTKDFLAILDGSSWTASQQTMALDFEENSFTESRADTEPVKKKMIVQASEKSSAVEGGSTLERYTASASIDGTVYFMTLERAVSSHDPSKPASEWAVRSQGFDNAQSYVRSESSTEFEVKGLSEEFKAMIDGGDAEMAEAMKEYCAQYFPTASNAEWSESATVDWGSETGSVATSFILNNTGKTQLSVTYDKTKKDFDIRKVG